MHSFFIDQLPAPGEMALLEGGERDHLFKTLRARPGEVVQLLDGRGGAAEAEVAENRQLRVLQRDFAEPPETQLILCCAAPRRQKLDLVLKQAVELAVAEIRIVRCEFSVAKPEGSSRWDALLKEACKQSGCRFLPRISVWDSLPELLQDLQQSGAALYFGAVTDPGKYPAVPGQGQIAWLVGPEGGFSASEEELLRRSGAQPLSLGPVILRLETAAVCGLAALRILAQLTAVFLLVLVLTGCDGGGKHPALLKAEQCRAEGKYQEAKRYLQTLLKARPESAEGHLLFAGLCDENLDDPFGAIEHYREYLRLAPDSENVEAVQAWLAAAKEKYRRKLNEAAGEIDLQEKIALLQRQKQALTAKVNALENAKEKVTEAAGAVMQTVQVLQTPAEEIVQTPAPSPAPPAAAPAAETVPEIAAKPVVEPVQNPVIAPVEPAPQKPAAPRLVTVEYRIKSGDTLGKIARRYYGSASRYGKIMAANNLTERSILQIGQKVIVPDVEEKRAGGR